MDNLGLNEAIVKICNFKALFQSRDGDHFATFPSLGTTGTIPKVMPISWRLRNPLLQKPQIVAFHRLEITIKIVFDPASDVSEPLGKLGPGIANAPVDRNGIAVFEVFDRHEEHGACTTSTQFFRRNT